MWEKDCSGNGQGHPPLSYRLHRGPAAALTHAEPSSHRSGNKHFQLSPGKFGAVVCLVTVPMKAKNCQSCQSNESFTTHLQTYSALRKENTVCKSDWLKQSLSVVQTAINAVKWNLTAPDSGKQAIFLFFLQISQGGTFTSRSHLPERQPAGKGSSHSCPAVPDQRRSPGITRQPVRSLIPLSASKYQNILFLNRRLKTVMQIFLILMHRQMTELKQ